MATLVVIAAFWYVATTGLGLISAGRFPAPSDVETAAVQAFVRGYTDTTLLVHVLHSLRLVALGFLASVTLGGFGTAFGALVGSLVIGIITDLSTVFIPSNMKYVAALAVMIVILLVRPQGILGKRSRIG